MTTTTLCTVSVNISASGVINLSANGTAGAYAWASISLVAWLQQVAGPTGYLETLGGSFSWIVGASEPNQSLRIHFNTSIDVSRTGFVLQNSSYYVEVQFAIELYAQSAAGGGAFASDNFDTAGYHFRVNSITV